MKGKAAPKEEASIGPNQMVVWHEPGYGYGVRTGKGFVIIGCMSKAQAERVGYNLIDDGF